MWHNNYANLTKDFQRVFQQIFTDVSLICSLNYFENCLRLHLEKNASILLLSTPISDVC